MEEIQLSNFQKNINEIIESIVRSHKSIIIRDNGNLLVKITPVSQQEKDSWLGCMKDKGKITGDIISPVEDINNWNVLSE